MVKLDYGIWLAYIRPCVLLDLHDNHSTSICEYIRCTDRWTELSNDFPSKRVTCLVFKTSEDEVIFRLKYIGKKYEKVSNNS